MSNKKARKGASSLLLNKNKKLGINHLVFLIFFAIIDTGIFEFF